MSSIESTPKVSVVMPAYNAGRYVQEAIDSVLAQTLRDFELLVIDDGSTDETASIAEECARHDSRIHLLGRPHRGIVPALNEACELAIGTYIARLDADDTAFPDRLERQVAFLDEHPGIALLGGSMRLMKHDGTHIRDAFPPLGHREIVVALADYNCFFHSSVMFRRSAWRDLGGYRAALLHAEDYDLWLRMAEKYEVRNLPWFMGRFRLHESQISLTQREQQVISTYACREAAKVRAAGKPDPCDSVELATREFLIDLGMDAEQLNAAILEAHLGVAYASGRTLRLDALLHSLYAAGRYFAQHGGRLKRAITRRYKPRM